MGLTLIAIFTAALLLPGIIAARAFYYAGQTREVEVPLPSMSTAEGISLVGVFSVLVHVAYIISLKIIGLMPVILSLPVANPYIVFVEAGHITAIDLAWSLFAGLTFLSAMAVTIGLIAGNVVLKLTDRSWFYGPLADVILLAEGDDKFITAYVVSKVQEGDRLVGYQGTVDSLFRDTDRFPCKIVLKDVVPFYLKLSADGPERIEADQVIDWLVLSDWHNIAFRVFQLLDEP